MTGRNISMPTEFSIVVEIKHAGAMIDKISRGFTPNAQQLITTGFVSDVQAEIAGCIFPESFWKIFSRPLQCCCVAVSVFPLHIMPRHRRLEDNHFQNKIVTYYNAKLHCKVTGRNSPHFYRNKEQLFLNEGGRRGD